MPLDECHIYIARAVAHWGLTLHNTLVHLLWKQITTPHVILQTHHCYTDNQKAKSDWRGSANGYLWGGKWKTKLRGRPARHWQWETVSIYITPCTTCGQLMRAKNRLFWENIDLLFPCVTSVIPWGGRGRPSVSKWVWVNVVCTNAPLPGWSALDLNQAGSSMIMTGAQKVMLFWPT